MDLDSIEFVKRERNESVPDVPAGDAETPQETYREDSSAGEHAEEPVSPPPEAYAAENEKKDEELSVESFLKKHKGIKIFLIIFAAIIVLSIIFSLFGGGEKRESTDKFSISYPSDKEFIGVVKIEGEITGETATDYYGNPTGYYHEWVMTQLDALIESRSNAALLLYIDSPGGSAFESVEVYDKVNEYKEVTGRPVYAYMHQTAASGGYYIAAPADKIFAHKNTRTGSIGVYMGPYLEVSGLLQKLGVKAEIFKSASNKAMGNSYEPMTDEQRAIINSQVEETYNDFLDAVSSGRDMDREKVKALADGRVYTARQALDNGLIDVIADFEETKAAVIKETGLTEETPFCTSTLTTSHSLVDLIFGSVAGLTEAIEDQGKTELESVLDIAGSTSDLKLYMMAE